MKEQLAIVTGCFGPDYLRIAEVSLPTIRDYAERVGAELVVLDKRRFPFCTGHWEKLQIGRLLNRFDRVAWMDIDLVVNPRAPSIFDCTPPRSVCAFEEGKIFTDRLDELRRDAPFYGFPTFDYRTYFNSGVLVVNAIHWALFKLPDRAKCEPMSEQNYLNLTLALNRFDFHDLDLKWNGMHSLRKPGDRLDLWTVHYAGWPRTPDWIDRMTNAMKDDLLNWRTA